MPPFVRKGPDFPVELLQAHERGRLVLFCGAGVSLGAGLPSFKGLIDRVYGSLGDEKLTGEAAAYRNGAYDRVFELLERRLDPQFVRQAVARVLTPAGDTSLQAHLNLLKLAQGLDGKLRLITTNFDPLFAKAGAANEIEIGIHRAPFVPVPKPSWTGLVHLHGALPHGDELTTRESLSGLVLSSSDFGRAYLTEGWASRFLRELFREFDVLFVGYSVNDPAVRYVIDALASQRRQGEAFHGAWVLAGVRGGKREGADRERWLELGVDPLFYNQAGRHRFLYRSLEEWAYLYRGGLLTRAGWATRKYSLPPDSSREDDAKMAIWALAEPTGTAARAWADADRGNGGAPTPEESRTAHQWLKVFEESEQVDERRIASRLLSALAPREQPLLYLIGGRHLTPELPPATYHLARWLARYLEEDWLIGRLVARRGVIHPQFARVLREELGNRSIPETWKRRLLETLSSPAYQEAATRSLTWDRRPNHVSPGNPVGRMELVRVLEPIPVFRESRDLRVGLAGEEPQPAFEPELTPAGNDLDVRFALEGFEAPGGERRLAALAPSITRLVELAADWLMYLQPGERQAALSWRAMQSIADDGQERLGEAQWATILSFAARSLAALAHEDTGAARSLVERWLHHGHVLFQRLALHALAEHPDLTADLGVDLLLERDATCLWELYLTRERERFFRMAAARISAASMNRLVATILTGPPADKLETRPAEEVRRARERAVWRLLTKLEIGGAKLDQEAVDRLRGIEREFEWAPQTDFLDELLVYSVDIDEEPAVASLLGTDLKALTSLLGEGSRSPTIAHWDELARRRPTRALTALRRCSKRGFWPIERWSEFINSAPFKPHDRPLRVRLLTVLWRTLETAPNDVLAALQDSLCWLLSATARDLPNACHDHAIHLWDRLWPLAPSQPEAILSPTDSFSQALNHPAGQLAKALLGLLSATLPEKGGGIPLEIQSRLETVLATARPEGAKYGQLTVAAHLPYLYFVDDQWATQHILPMFDWAVELAPDAWNAFLHHPRFSPDLLGKLRANLVETVKRRFQLPDGTRRVAVELLGVLGVETREWIPGELQRKLVHSLHSSELADLASRLKDLAESEPEGAAQRWREAIQPWFSKFWPKDLVKRSPEESDALAEMVLETGDALEEALADVGPFLVPMRDSRIPFLLSSQRRDILEKRPTAVLELVDRIIPQEPSEAEPWGFHGLEEVLAALESTEPALVDTPRFRRLREFQLRR